MDDQSKKTNICHNIVWEETNMENGNTGHNTFTEETNMENGNTEHNTFTEETNMENRNSDHNAITMNSKEDGKMGKVMKTGIVAAGGVLAAGLAFGMSPITTQAAELESGDSETFDEAFVETAEPENIEEAAEAMEEAEDYLEISDAAIEEAQNDVYEAQEAVDSASKEADIARSEAEEAFEAAKTDAAEADAAAQKDVDEAERAVDEAEGNVQQARDNVAASERALQEAEYSVDEAVTESPVSENDITEQECVHAVAQTALSDAEDALREAETLRNYVAGEADKRESAKSDAETALWEAEMDKNAADAAAEAAEEAVVQAERELQSAEELKNGIRHIEDTVQYKEEKEAKDMMERASEEIRIAAEYTDTAAEDLANAEVAVEAAEKERESAVNDLNIKETELSEAEKAKEAANNVRLKAQDIYDNAVAVSADADSYLNEAENAVTEAEADVKTAEDAKAAFDVVVRAASDAVDTARENAEAAVNAAIETAKKAASEKQMAVEKARNAMATAEERYKQGTLGLIDWMLEKDGLTKDQKQDLQFARDVLMKASEEDFSDWAGGNNTGLPEARDGKVVVIGDEKDATNLENLIKSIEIMRKINELRATDDNYTGDLQRHPSYTNFYFMATAEAGAMRGAGLMRHSRLTTSCENLAFGSMDPTVGWYNREKTVFDRIKGELGITKITSMNDVAEIEKEANRQDVVIGHYTNLFYAADQVMGVGFTQYRVTSCYNASNSSNYADDRYDRAMHLYTIDEFEQIATDYYQSVNKFACKEVLEMAVSEQFEAENRLKSLLANKDSSVEKAIQDAKAELISREAEADQAAQDLADAKEILNDAKTALEEAGKRKQSADQVRRSALNALNKAVEESRIADTAFAFAEKELYEAKQFAAGAETALKDAMTVKAAASAVFEEKKAALTDTNRAFEEAVAAHSAAEKRLLDLTSDETINALKEQKHLADATLQSAMEDQASKEEALKQAEEDLAQVEKEALKVATDLKEAEKRVAEARKARDSAQQNVEREAIELENLREEYIPVLRAINARDAAKENLRLAEAALATAESDLFKAESYQSMALQTKAITNERLYRATSLDVEEAMEKYIKDEEFAYLNEYISAIKTADSRLQAANVNLQTAISKLGARRDEHEKAQKAYLAAVADLAVFKEREGVKRTEALSDSNEKYSGENAVLHKINVPAVSKKNSESAVLKDLVNTSESIQDKEGSAGRVNIAKPVATGDTSNVMALLAELFASTGIMAVFFRGRKGKMEKKKK